MHNLEFWLDKPFRASWPIGPWWSRRGAPAICRSAGPWHRARHAIPDRPKRLDHGQSLLVQDAGVASERQALRARTIVRCWFGGHHHRVGHRDPHDHLELGFNIAPAIASAGIASAALSFARSPWRATNLSGIFMVAEDQLGIGYSWTSGRRSAPWRTWTARHPRCGTSRAPCGTCERRDPAGGQPVPGPGPLRAGTSPCLYDTNIDLVADMIEH
ncbi:hypothetical protein QJS66_21160 [Kocuria rhizophila]|nr:hypothetical protein QJS66_21160 [Kocuria rhizophila]